MVTLKLILVFFRTACFNFMLNHMDVNNCMGLLHIAERLDCKVGIEIIVILICIRIRFYLFIYYIIYNVIYLMYNIFRVTLLIIFIRINCR